MEALLFLVAAAAAGFAALRFRESIRDLFQRKLAPTQKEQYSLAFPREHAADAFWRFKKEQLILVVAVAAGGVLLALLARPEQEETMESGSIARPGFSEGDLRVRLQVKGEGESEAFEKEISVSVGQRQPDPEMLNAMFEEGFAEGERLLSAGGDSMDRIEHNLDLPEEIGDYLIPGGSYKIREETTPGTEYSKAGDYYFSVDPDGKMKNSNGEEITSVTIIDSLTNENTLKVAVVDADATSTYLSGAEFVIMDEDGSLLKDATVISISRDEDGNISLVLPEGSKYTKDGVLTFKNRKEPTGAAGTISVEVRNYYDNDPTDDEPGAQIYANNGATYYVALFSDADKKNRVSDVKTVKIKKGYKMGRVKFEKLISGTYYLAETDEYGNVIGDIADPKQALDDFYAEFVHNGKKTSKVVIKVDEESQTAADTEVVNLNNQYFKLQPGFTYTAAFTVTKVVKDSDGSEMVSNNTFYVGVYTKNSSGKYAYIGKKAIKMGGASQKTVTIELPMSASVKEKSVMVKEVDSKGNEVKSGEAYDIKVEPGEIVLKRGDTETPSVTITNTKIKGSTEETETEDPGDLGDGKAELKLTKKVIYKDTAIRVNSVYYIGIFDDAGLKNLRYKKAMTFSNASELTATLKINLNKLSSREITFYFAEVDEQGKPLSGGKTFGYDISLNKKSVTLNSKNMADEVVVTNTVIDGGTAQQQLTDPSSGFAGDSAALATAQSLAADSNSSGKTKTGDSSPITQRAVGDSPFCMRTPAYGNFSAYAECGRRGE